MKNFKKSELTTKAKKAVKGGSNPSNILSDILESIGIIIHDVVDG